MANYRANDVIRLTRTALSISQEELCDGICSVETLSRIERGITKVKKETYHMLMAKMERNPDKAYAICSGEDLELLEERTLLRNAIADYEYEEAEKCFSKMKNRLGNDNLNNQFKLRMQTLLDYTLGRLDAETTIKKLEEALCLTAPDYHKFLENDQVKIFPYTGQEILLLMNIAGCEKNSKNFDRAIPIYRLLLRCLESEYIVGDEKISTRLAVMRNYAHALGMKGDFEAALEMVDQVRTESILHDLGYILELAVSDSEWLHRELSEYRKNESDEKLAVLEYRQGYYLALARGSKSMAECLRDKYRKYFSGRIEII